MKNGSNISFVKSVRSTLDRWEVSGTKGKIPQEIKLIGSILGNPYNNSTPPQIKVGLS